MTVFGIILAILVFIVFFGLSIRFFGCILDLPWWGHILFSPIHTLLSGLCTALLFVILASMSTGRFEPDETTKKEIYIYSIGLNSKNDVHGSFCLGTGTINGTSVPTYRFYVMNNGKYHLEEINANNFDIVCTNNTKPKIVIDATKEVAKPIWLKFIFNEDIHVTIDEKDWTGTIYIPENSIVQSFSIQL